MSVRAKATDKAVASDPTMNPPSSVCSTPDSSCDFELSSSLPSTCQKPVIGGLSCLFSSSSLCGDELKSEELKEPSLSSSCAYSCPSKFSGSSLREHLSPVSVFAGAVSSECSGGSTVVVDSAKRSHALSSGLQVRGDELNVEELPFKIEAEDWYTEPYWKKLLLDAQSRHKIFYDELVVQALNMAEKAHRGQTRASGDPYLQHCVETAELLASIGANSTVVAAGLLHDTLDDSFMNYDSVFGTSGAGVADLVKEVSKLSHLSKLARDSNTASKTDEADRLHTMFLAMADVRAVLIKLADRLHNMMTLDALPPAKQQRFAKETLKIFAPLANRLGISSWKEKLETLCFKHLHPDQHEELSSKLEDSFDEATITSAKEKLQHALKESGIPYLYLSGRQKSLYSIYSKMLKKKLTMDEIHDIHGLRLIVDNEEDCYKALRVVHQLWPEVPGRLKDYIVQPKSNGYKSLHTVVDLVVNEEKVPLEVQIRTKEMHLQAEFSFAAHWRYKEGDCEHSPFVLRMIEWARWVITWQCETMNSSYPDSIRPSCTFPSHSEDCPHSYKPHCGQDGPVFVIMKDKDKMSVQECPANSTIMDLLEKSGRGSTSQEELKPRLNLRPVNDPTCKLKMGDVLELTPAIPDKSLTTEYKEKIQKMYDLELTESSTGPSISMVGWGSWP